MNIHLVAPFRTLLNFDSDLLLARPDATAQTLQKSIRILDSERKIRRGGSFSSPFCSQPKPIGFRKFTSLSDNLLDHFASPLFQFNFSDQELPSINTAIISQLKKVVPEWSTIKISIEIKSARFDCFDNTVGVAWLELNLDGAPGEVRKGLPILDKAFTEYCALFISDECQKIIESIIYAMIKVQKTPQRNAHLRVLNPKAAVIFKDVPGDTFPKWPKHLDSLLWVNRTVQTDPSDAQMTSIALDWANVRDATTIPAELEGREVIQVGTNVFSDAERAQLFASVMVTIQYFYTLLDIVSDIVRISHAAVGEPSLGNLRNLSRRLRRVSAFADVAANELNNFIFGLQNERKRFGEKIMEAMDFPSLIQNLDQWNNASRAKLDGLEAQNSERSRRLLQAGIIFIGAFQVFDFALNISWFGKTEPAIINDSVPGLFNLVADLPVDLVLNTLVIVAVVVALFAASRRSN